MAVMDRSRCFNSTVFINKSASALVLVHISSTFLQCIHFHSVVLYIHITVYPTFLEFVISNAPLNRVLQLCHCNNTLLDHCLITPKDSIRCWQDRESLKPEGISAVEWASISSKALNLLDILTKFLYVQIA